MHTVEFWYRVLPMICDPCHRCLCFEAKRLRPWLRAALPASLYWGVPMFTPRAIGFVRSPYRNTGEVPKGLGAKHDATGVLEILPEFELGLTDIEGFSHLIVLWVFDRAEGFELLGRPPS